MISVLLVKFSSCAYLLSKQLAPISYTYYINMYSNTEVIHLFLFVVSMQVASEYPFDMTQDLEVKGVESQRTGAHRSPRGKCLRLSAAMELSFDPSR